MERLTNKREADAQREEYERRLANGYPRNIPEERFLRLAAYEDTGWTPEMLHKLGENAGHMWDFAQAAGKMTVGRLKELAEADEDGRCVVLPCKVGDVMYKLFRAYTECTSYQVRKDNYCCEGCMVPCDSREVTVIRAIQPNSLPEVVRYIEDIGKTVFLSREEAEKALEEMEGK